MFADQALRCECGYEVRASDEAALVDEVRRHASETHGISFSAEEALAVLLRLELDGGVLADLAMVEATARGEEHE
jgi:predicted small metal-binding protein